MLAEAPVELAENCDGSVTTCRLEGESCQYQHDLRRYDAFIMSVVDAIGECIPGLWRGSPEKVGVHIVHAMFLSCWHPQVLSRKVASARANLYGAKLKSELL